MKQRLGIRMDESSLSLTIGAGSADNFTIVRSETLRGIKGEVPRAIREWLGKDRVRHAHVVLPAQYSVMKIVEFPAVTAKKLRNLVDFEIHHSLHLPFEDPIFDLVPTGDTSADTSLQKYLMFAASSKLVQLQVDLIEQAQVKVLSVELAPFSVARILESQFPDFRLGTRCVVDFAESGFETMIFHRGVVLLKRFTQSASVNLASNFERDNHTREILFAVERSVSFFNHSLGYRDELLAAIYVVGSAEYTDAIIPFLREQTSVPVYRIKSIGQYEEFDAVSAGAAMKERA